MSKKRGKKKVGQSEHPSEGKAVGQAESPERTNHQFLAWRISRFDWDGPWGVKALDDDSLHHLIRGACHHFESMTWAELLRASGGKTKGNNHHYVPVKNLSKPAKDRLRDLQSDDLEELFSLRIDGTKRLYGVRDGRAFCALWYDPAHSICPSRKRRT